MIDIVIPVYNEKEHIKLLFDRINNTISSPKRVMVVYDFEGDNTLPVVRAIANNYPFEIALERNIYGKGALQAILTGMRKAAHEAVLVIMADLSDSLEIVDNMYQTIVQQDYDIVCGSRYMKGGSQHGGPLLKGLFSRIAGLSLHVLSRIPTHDISNSFKMYRTSLLNAIEIESDGGFEIGMEITVKAYLNGYRVTEIPSSWRDRSSGESRFKMWQWIPHYLHWYWLCVSRTWLGRKKKTRTARSR